MTKKLESCLSQIFQTALVLREIKGAESAAFILAEVVSGLEKIDANTPGGLR